MHLYMPSKGIYAGQFLSTDHAREKVLTHMNAHMSFEPTSLDKFFPTCLTAIWPLSRVDTLMGLQSV